MAMLDEALTKANVPLRAEQKTAIQKIVADAQAANKDRMLKLATQVEQGKVDPATLPARTDVRTAIDAVLDAPQKQALEAAHKDRREHGFRGEGEGEGKAKHEHAWGRGHGHGEGMHGDLNLSPDQKQKIHEAMKAEGKDGEPPFTARTRGDPPFTARTRGDQPFTARTRGDQMVRFFEAAAPILTQEQRATLARHLREKANR